MIRLILILFLACPAWPELTVQELLIRRTGVEVNVRVNLSDDGSPSAPGKLSLFIRPAAGEPWEPFKVWFIKPLKPGQRVARDFFFSGNPRLQKIARENPHFEVKARLTVGQSDQEKIAVAGD